MSDEVATMLRYRFLSQYATQQLEAAKCTDNHALRIELLREARDAMRAAVDLLERTA